MDASEMQDKAAGSAFDGAHSSALESGAIGAATASGCMRAQFDSAKAMVRFLTDSVGPAVRRGLVGHFCVNCFPQRERFLVFTQRQPASGLALSPSRVAVPEPMRLYAWQCGADEVGEDESGLRCVFRDRHIAVLFLELAWDEQMGPISAIMYNRLETGCELMLRPAPPVR